MTDAALALTQLRYDQKSFWRNPMYVFFTVVQPVIFLVIFVTVFGNELTPVNGHLVKRSTYYVPGILTLGVVSATFFNLTISLTRLRERGIHKRVRSTPLPPWMFLAGRVGSAIVVALLLVVLLVGAAAMCCLAFALTSFVGSEDAAAPMTNVIVLPLLFISGIFIPNDQIPSGMQQVADLFPIKHLFDALLRGFNPAAYGTGVAWGDLAVVAVWGAAGLLVALVHFRWTPRGG